MLVDRGYEHSVTGDFFQMLWVHDEVQMACRTLEIAEDVLKISQEAMRATQKHFNFKVQLDVDGKIGRNWAETH